MGIDRLLDRRLSERSILRVQQIEKERLIEMNRKAARCIASSAIDAEDCAELLAMLGLDASEGKNRDD